MRAILVMLFVAAMATGEAAAQERTQFVLAISWEPAFCETAPDRSECTSQTADRFDATNFALHGLWPTRMEFCKVSGALRILDAEGQWNELPAPNLTAETRAALDEAMPGSQSYLDRHEWLRHGTCYGTNAEEYFTDSLAMLDTINGSAVRDLFARNIGRQLTMEEIRASFDEAFGTGTGERVRVACVRDGARQIISELTIGLTGDIEVPADYADLTLNARPTRGGGAAGVVDPVGLQ